MKLFKQVATLVFVAFGCLSWAQTSLDSSEVSLSSIRLFIPEGVEVENKDGALYVNADNKLIIVRVFKDYGVIQFFGGGPLDGKISDSYAYQFVSEYNANSIYATAYLLKLDDEKKLIYLSAAVPYDGGINKKNFKSNLDWFYADMKKLYELMAQKNMLLKQ